MITDAALPVLNIASPHSVVLANSTPFLPVIISWDTQRTHVHDLKINHSKDIMAVQMPLQETLASRNSAPLLLIASLLGICMVVARKWFGKKSAGDASSIPLYTPKTSAAGDFKKRWSHDNPNTLREAYSQVRHLVGEHRIHRA